MHSKSTPLLELLNERWKEFIKDAPDTFKRPVYSDKDVIARALVSIGRRQNSDPFALGRAALHIRQGFINPFEAIKDAQQ
jgi:hypothetical protein